MLFVLSFFASVQHSFPFSNQMWAGALLAGLPGFIGYTLSIMGCWQTQHNEDSTSYKLAIVGSITTLLGSGWAVLCYLRFMGDKLVNVVNP
jgi:hypothetical protein